MSLSSSIGALLDENTTTRGKDDDDNNNDKKPQRAMEDTARNATATTHENLVNDTDTDSDTYTDNTVPYFILHVGPKKTATTYIQNTAEVDLTNVLAADNYVFLGPSIMHKSLADAVQMQMELGNNIFASDEYLSIVSTEEKCNAWKEMSIPISTSLHRAHERAHEHGHRWDLQVVITYRRFHSILPSYWDQLFKLKRTDAFNDDSKRLGRHLDWPGINNDYRIVTFEEWFVSQFYKSKEKLSSLHKLQAYYAYNSWKDCSNGIKVVNYHVSEEQDFLTEFICEALPGAINTCRELRERVKVRKTLSHNGVGNGGGVNPSVNLDYDILAVRAYEKGLIDPIHTRIDVVNRVKKHAEKNNLHLPLSCPNATVLDFMYQMSLDGEKWALSTIRKTKQSRKAQDKIDIQPLTEEELFAFNTDWEKTLSDKKFCTVDAEQALEQDEWIKFFQDVFQKSISNS